MTPHDQMRRDQSLVLRDSLLGSSFSWLTIAVAVLFAASLRSSPVISEPPIRILDIDDHVLEDILALTDGGLPAPTLVPSTQVDGRVVPLDVQRDAPILSSAEVAEPTSGVLDAGTGLGAAGGTGTIQEATGRGADVIPDPTTWIQHDEVPQVVTRVTPAYPDIAIQARMEGRLVVRAYVGPDGRVRRAEVESGPAVFAEAATGAVARWVFTPALANGHPVGVWVRVPVLFRLD